jgi:signal recognition particle subunit SRP54
VLIVDTAGRLAVDEEMMDEIRRVHRAIDPAETLFVVDAMTGQDAANTAKAFARGAAAHRRGADQGRRRRPRRRRALGAAGSPARRSSSSASARRLEALEPFHPERMASRILGMGDVLTLIEEASARSTARRPTSSRARSEGQTLRSRGLPRPAAADEEDGRA